MNCLNDKQSQDNKIETQRMRCYRKNCDHLCWVARPTIDEEKLPVGGAPPDAVLAAGDEA
jgi:hypothetical protein